MKTAGIIAEYNPFHNGHKFHIDKTREICGADAVVAVMSGNFVQRGDAAICDKFSRAEMAVRGGADLVVELPCVYACQSAELFAKGGVKLLDSMQCDFISFGIENEDTENLQKISDFVESDVFKSNLKAELKSGKSYPTAFSDILKSNGFDDICNSPNNILAIEYLRAITNMKPIGIKREGSLHDMAGSASDIRNRMLNGSPYGSLVPQFCEKMLKNVKIPDRKILSFLIIYKLRTAKPDELKNTPDVSEGLENRIIECAKKASDLDELCNMIKTKRYTMARIRRILINFLLGITKDDIHQNPMYIRVLGMNKMGMEVLSSLRKNTDIPIITKTADAKKCTMLDIDITASDVYSVLTGTPAMADYKKTPVIIKD